MSDGVERQVNRRQFLSLGLAVAGGVVGIGPRRGEAEDTPGVGNRKDVARWSFLSDTHISADPDHRFRGFYPHRNLQEVVAGIASDPPDGLVITGDLSRSRGGPGAYQNVKSLLTPLVGKQPIYMALGNHDNRRNFLEAFEKPADFGEAVQGKHIVTAMAGPIRMVILDSLLYTNLYGGMLGRPQRTWLETYLNICDDTPTVLFMHHTPRVDLLDAGRLFDIIRPIPKVKAVVYGHSHKYEFCESDGIQLVNLPASGYNFTGAQPVGWVDARLNGKGGEFVLHAVGGNARRDGRTTMVRWRT
jgi:Icc protein